MESNRKPKVLLQYLSLIHYRESVFREVVADGRIDFAICCGKNSPYPSMRNFDEGNWLKTYYIQNKIFLKDSLRLVWQSGSFQVLSKAKPDIVILLGVDPHIVSTLFLFWYAKLQGIKVVWWGHATFGKQGAIGRAFRKIFYQLADGIMTYNEAGKERLGQMGIDTNKIIAIGNCLNDDAYPDAYPKKTRTANKDQINLIYTGRIYKNKKLHLLIDAVALLKEKGFMINANIIGRGPEETALKERIKEKGLETNVHMLGAIYGEKVREYVSKADVGIIPSATGLSAIQYLGMGVPVITDNGPFHGPEISTVIHNETGLIYQMDDAGSLADAIESIIPRIDEMSQKGYQLIQDQWTPEKVKDAIIESVLMTYHDRVLETVA